MQSRSQGEALIMQGRQDNRTDFGKFDSLSNYRRKEKRRNRSQISLTRVEAKEKASWGLWRLWAQRSMSKGRLSQN
jgi:hypothetical protein